MLGTTGDRADAAEFGQHALAAADALLGPGRLFFQDAEELRVEPGIHGLAGKALGQGLHAGGATERHHGLAALHRGRQVLDELVVALALDGDLLDLHRLLGQFARHAHAVAGNADFALAVGARSCCRSWGRMSTLEARGITMGLPAKTDDREVDELRGRLAALPIARQARVLEGVLTPGLRLRVLADQVRRQVGSLSDEEEAEAERKIDEAVKEVRRSRTRAG